jgi:hypothetical protein
MKRKDIETRYYDHLRRERRKLDEFAASEIEWADDLLSWYRARKREIPDDEYRAAVFFRSGEFQRKPGSLTLLRSMYARMLAELPEPTPETAFDLLAFRYRMYAAALKQGGYDDG